jgi:uncharacterized Fe-S radical SAM superfamily protein PflX
VVLSILHAKTLGLKLPIVYNTSSFNSLASIELLDGLVDIFFTILQDLESGIRSDSLRQILMRKS